MNTIEKTAVCLMVVLFLSLSVQPGLASGEKFVEEFKAVISKDTIKVGENAEVTFQGKQLDVAGVHTVGDIGEEFASVVKLTRVDKTKFKVTGLAPGKAVLKFKNGDKEASVKVTVVARGPN
jgi:hypothetical protein